MEEAWGETFLSHELRENFIKDFSFIPQDGKLVETAKKIKEFIEPTENKKLNHDQPTIDFNNIVMYPFWNFIKDFNFIPQDENLVETTKQIKAFIQPTENKTLKYNRPTINYNNIQIGVIPQSTRLQMDNENMEGKSFRWKSNHVEITKPIRIVLKVETTDKEDIDRMITAYFPATFSQFKEWSRPINESKEP